MPGEDSLFSALSDPVRRRILGLLRRGQLAAGEIAQALDMTPAAVSYHLAKLRRAGLVYETRYKNYILYELDLTVLNEAILWLTGLKEGEL